MACYPFLYSVALSNVQRLGQYTLEKNYLSLEDSKAAETLKLVLNNLPSIVETHKSDSAQIQKCVYDLNDLLKQNGDLENLSISNKTVSYLYGLNDLLQPEVVVNDERLLKSSLSFKLPTKVKSQHDQVPLHLVPCLAYCALYPEGYQIVREILVNQWMAEGFLELQTEGSSSNEVELEDIGNRYFNELLSMGVFVEPVYCFGGNISNQQAPEKVYSCQMHSDSHKLACQIARKEVFIFSRYYYNNKFAENAIYMALHDHDDFDYVILGAYNQPVLETIRTCLCFTPFISFDVMARLRELRRLRTFDSSICDEGKDFDFVFQPEIRCLALSGCKGLKFIDLSWMQQLQTLAIDKCVIDVLSPMMRHLYYTSKETSQTTLEIHTSSLRILQLSDCRLLTSLWLSNPANFSSLRRLRIFECPRLASLPDSIDLLSSVEEMVFHNCARLDLNCGRSMNSLPNLQHMELIGLPKLSKLPAGLQTAKALNYLMIADCVSLKSMDPVLQHLHALEILCVYDCRNLSIDPCEFQNLTALQSLDISRRTFKEGPDIWPHISHIPEIIVDGQHLDRSAGFGSLKSDDKKDFYSSMNFPYFIISLEMFEINRSLEGLRRLSEAEAEAEAEAGHFPYDIYPGLKDFITKRYDVEEKLHSTIFKEVQNKRQLKSTDYGYVRALSRKYKLKNRNLLPFKMVFSAVIWLRTMQRKSINLCIFPGGYEIGRDKLAQLWISRGLVSEEDLKGQFDHLVRKKQIIETRKDIMTGKSWCKFSVDKVEPILERRGKIEANRYTLIKDEKFGVDTYLSSSSRRVFVASKSMNEAMFKTLEGFSELRTLVLIPDYGSSLTKIPFTFFKALQCMQELDISGSHISELPTSIGYMKELRLLDLSFTPIERLPESIGLLTVLQSLRLIGCKHLHKLPKAMKKLVNLYHLDFDVIGQLTCMPEGLGSLTKLRTLSAFIVSKEEGCTIKELSNMRHLRGSLCISRLERVSADVPLEAHLYNKRHLTQLHLKWSNNVLYESKDREDAQKLLEALEPANDLTNLQISYYPGLQLPKWIQTPGLCLESITLVQCEVEILCTMELLKNLKHLYIYDLNQVKLMATTTDYRKFGTYVSYPELKTLVIDGMLGQPWGSGPRVGDFPHLSRVCIKHCPNLETLAFLSYMESLTYLEISFCEKIKWLPEKVSSKLETIIIYQCQLLKERCSKNGYDRGKIQHVPNIWIDGENVRSTHKQTTVSEVEDKGKGKAEDKDEGKARTRAKRGRGR